MQYVFGVRLVVFLVLVVASAAEAASTASDENKKKHHKDPSTLSMMQLLFSGKGDSYGVDAIPQKISVIGAGQGRTGTSSLRVALARLGLKSYHMKEGVMETPGHIDLWHVYYHQKSITIDDVFDRIEADGFNATLDAPTSFYFERQFVRNPHAKVILTLRKGGGESWAKSMHDSVLQFHPLLQRVPLRWIPRMIKQSQFFVQMNLDYSGPVSGPANVPVREHMAEAYDKWTEHVKATIPADQLLIFYAHDGWEPLCRFLSPLSNEIETRCDEVLASGDPYPHANDTAFIQRLIRCLGAICTVVEWSPLLVALFLIVAFAKRFNIVKSKEKRF